MGQISISNDALLKKINQQLEGQEGLRFLVSNLAQRINEIPNWRVDGYVVSGQSMLHADELEPLNNVLEQFSSYEVDWTLPTSKTD